jgi:hypothetical protein
MAWGINDIDVRAFVFDRAVFRENCNATFFFQVIGIHNAVINLLVFTEGSGLFEQLINQSGFAMVNVSDDGDIS